MGFLFASKKKEVPAVTGLQIQTAVNVLPIPIIYGCPRIQMNVIYVNGFRAVKAKSGGKGILTSGKGGGGGYKYFATFIGALGEGEIGQLRVIFDNQAIYTPTTAPFGKVFVEFIGSPTQNPWNGVEDTWPDDAFAYRHTAYIGFYDWPLDSSATLPFLNFIVEGLFQGTCPLNLYTAPDAEEIFFDADPAECIFDFLTNAFYGTGFPEDYIDQTTLFTSANGYDPLVGDSALSTYAQACGFGWSVVLNNTEPASSILDRWCKNLVVAPVWTGSILKFIPYWDTYFDDNPGWDVTAGIPLKYYQPDVTVLFDLTDDDFIQTNSGDDPVVVTRLDVADAKNTVRLDYHDRFNAFNSNVSEAKDESMVELFGPRVERMGTADEFTHGNYAAVASQIQLQRNISIRNTYEFKLGWQWCILDPMDIVTITDTVLELDRFPVRIRSIEEDEKGVLSIVAEEFPVGAATATAYPRQDNDPPTTFETQTPAPSVNTPIIFEPTASMLAARGEPVPTVVIGMSGGPSGVFDSNWGGAEVWLSNDNVTYVDFGNLQGPSRQGILTASLAAYGGTNPDNSNTLSVDVSESNSELETVTSTQAASGLSLCAIVDTAGNLELLGYTTATLTSPGNYDLTGLYRGFYNTQACSHLSGSKFCRIDFNIFEEPLPPQFIGTTLYVKLQSFNIWGQGIQDLSDCTAYSYDPNGAGQPVDSNTTIARLQAGQDVDLETQSTDAVDLNWGGSSSCSPMLVAIDLN